MKKIILNFIFCLILFLQSVAQAQEINIAFCVDKNYAIFTMLAINSIVKNKHSSTNLNFYIIENDLTKKQKQQINKYVKKYQETVKFVHIDNSNIPLYFEIERVCYQVTNIALARLLLPDLLPDIKKVLYLDADILVLSDLSELYNIELDGKYLCAMARDIADFNQYTGINKKNPINYNTGVVLMDLDKWRKEKISDQHFDYMKKNIARFKMTGNKNYEFNFGEQDLMNIILDDKIKTISQKWNNQNRIFDAKHFGYDIPGLMIDNATDGIIHYNGIYKPWMFFRPKHKGMKLYLQYWSTSGLNRYKIIYILKSLKIKFNSNRNHF